MQQAVRERHARVHAAAGAQARGDGELAHRNTARFFALRGLDIASAAYITALQAQIGDAIRHLGLCGQTRVMHVCEVICRQPHDRFETLHVWATCALSGRSTNAALCVSGWHYDERGEARRRGEREDALASPVGSALAHQPALFVDAAFAPFVRALWLCTHVAQVEAVRVLERCAARAAAEADGPTPPTTPPPTPAPTTMAGLLDSLLERDELHDAAVTEAYERAFRHVCGTLTATAAALDADAGADGRESPARAAAH